MILTVFDHEKTSTIQVPVTPSSTFVDVLRCCKGYTDEKYYLTAMFSNKEERVVEANEVPYEFVTRNDTFKRQFVIYKSEPDNIFLRGSHEHQDTKKRFTLSDLANFVSHHDRVVERQNKAINAMEERLKRLKKEEMMRRRGETNLLIQKPGSHVHDRKIELIRQQRGHPHVKRPGQGTSLQEIKAWFHEMDEEMERLKQRTEGSLQRILTTFEVSDLIEYRSGRFTQGLQKSYENVTTQVQSKENKFEWNSCKLDLKINDLRNRLNLNKKHVTPTQASKVQSGFSNQTRPKSAAEILLKSSRSSSSRQCSASLVPLISSKDVRTSPVTAESSSGVTSQGWTRGAVSQSSEIVDHVTRVFPTSSSSFSTTTSSLSTIASSVTGTTECQQVNAMTRKHVSRSVNHVSSLSVKFRQTPSDATSSSSFLTSFSNKRRQRSAFHVRSQEALPISPSSPAAGSYLKNGETHSSTNGAPPIPAKPKFHFANVVQRANNIESVISHSNALDDLQSRSRCSEKVVDIMTNKFNQSAGDSIEEIMRDACGIVISESLKSNDPITTTTPEDGDVAGTPNFSERSLTPSNLQTPLSLNTSQQQSFDRDFSPTSLSHAFIGSSPLVEVTPMSTNSDDLRESDSAIFNVSENQSLDDLCNDESYAMTTTGSLNDEDLPRKRREDDSFFSIPTSSNVSTPEDGQEASSPHEGSDPFVEVGVVELFPASPYPYPLTEVLEQLDGNASMLRHSAGGVRSLRNRLSSDDFHYHGDATHLAVEGKNLLFEEVHDSFQIKQTPVKFFDDLALEISLTSDDASGLESSPNKTSDIDNHDIMQQGDKEERIEDPVILPDILCTGKAADNRSECVSNISFKDGRGRDNEIIIITLNENQNMSDLEDNEPGIIVAGENEKDDAYKLSIDSTDDEEDDGSGSFSPLNDTFREDFKYEMDDVTKSVHEKITPIAEGNEVCDDLPNSDSPVIVKGILKRPSKMKKESFRVVFNPLAILLDAALQGELDVVKDIIEKHGHDNMVNDEGITALHNAICAGHSDIVHFLVTSGCDVNAADSDLWTPLHCAASCYNAGLVKFLVENGACVFAMTESEGETALDKCEDEEEDGGRCRRYLEEIQSKMTEIGAELHAAYDGQSSGRGDELCFFEGDVVIVCDKTKSSDDDDDDDDMGGNWCHGRNKRTGEEGYVPKNYLSLFPRVIIN